MQSFLLLSKRFPTCPPLPKQKKGLRSKNYSREAGSLLFHPNLLLCIRLEAGGSTFLLHTQEYRPFVARAQSSFPKLSAPWDNPEQGAAGKLPAGFFPQELLGQIWNGSDKKALLNLHQAVVKIFAAINHFEFLIFFRAIDDEWVICDFHLHDSLSLSEGF